MSQKKCKFFVFESEIEYLRMHIEAIMTSQMPRMQKLKLANDVIENTDSIEKFKLKIECLHKNYLTLAEEL